MENNEMKYEKAVSELEEIVDKMERDELDIDQLSEQLKRAKVLVKLCKDKLTKTDEEIKKLLSEEVKELKELRQMPWRAMFDFKSTKAVVLTPQRPKGAITP